MRTTIESERYPYHVSSSAPWGPSLGRGIMKEDEVDKW